MTRQVAVLSLAARIDAVQTVPLPGVCDPVNVLVPRRFCDRAVGAALEADGRKLALRPGLLLMEPERLHTAAGKPYAVFTPFWRALRPADRRRNLEAPFAGYGVGDVDADKEHPRQKIMNRPRHKINLNELDLT